jgi:hypothetical protein
MDSRVQSPFRFIYLAFHIGSLLELRAVECADVPDNIVLNLQKVDFELGVALDDQPFVIGLPAALRMEDGSVQYDNGMGLL